RALPLTPNALRERGFTTEDTEFTEMGIHFGFRIADFEFVPTYFPAVVSGQLSVVGFSPQRTQRAQRRDNIGYFGFSISDFEFSLLTPHASPLTAVSGVSLR